MNDIGQWLRLNELVVEMVTFREIESDSEED
jgi:hypothetical protein